MKKAMLYGVCLVALAILVGLISMSVGMVSVSWSDLVHLSDTQKLILFDVRLPRVLTAFIVGACLAAGGACFQGILQNPLADPYVLGISAGAGLGAAIAIVSGLAILNLFFLPVGAFSGAMLTVAGVYALVKLTRLAVPIHLILAGIMINAFFASLTLLLVFFSEKKMAGILFWLMGDLSSTPTSLLWGLYIVAGGVMVFLCRVAHPLNILTLGDETAQSLGIHVERLRQWVFLLASLLVGLAVSAGGIIGFIGLVIPHLLRLVYKDDFRFLIPASFVFGGTFLMLADMVARTILPQSELPVGVLTSFIGAPFFLVLFIMKLRQVR